MMDKVQKFSNFDFYYMSIPIIFDRIQAHVITCNNQNSLEQASIVASCSCMHCLKYVKYFLLLRDSYSVKNLCMTQIC
jgi:hypothetical protein